VQASARTVIILGRRLHVLEQVKAGLLDKYTESDVIAGYRDRRAREQRWRKPAM